MGDRVACTVIGTILNNAGECSEFIDGRSVGHLSVMAVEIEAGGMVGEQGGVSQHALLGRGLVVHAVDQQLFD